MTITVSVPDQLARQAEAEGLSVETYVERILEQNARVESADGAQERRSKAVREMAEFASQHHLTLGEGVRIRDLLHEGTGALAASN